MEEGTFLVAEMTPDGSLRVALRPIPDEEGNDDPGIWGVVLADVARHA